ncbi:hypothetical protein TSMEX_010201 [Taenia solium]|eukprot:TsM_000242400 transcript=TsM_000242400 gene=TsM_000242400
MQWVRLRYWHSPVRFCPAARPLWLAQVARERSGEAGGTCAYRSVWLWRASVHVLKAARGCAPDGGLIACVPTRGCCGHGQNSTWVVSLPLSARLSGYHVEHHTETAMVMDVSHVLFTLCSQPSLVLLLEWSEPEIVVVCATHYLFHLGLV